MTLPPEAVDAAATDNQKEMRKMMANGTVVHVDVLDEKGRTLLHTAGWVLIPSKLKARLKCRFDFELPSISHFRYYKITSASRS